MKIVIHARQAQLAEDFKKIVEEKLHSMNRFSVVIDRVEVEIIHEGNPRQGKFSHRVILTSHGVGPLLRAQAAAFNDVAAFDLAIKNFELQIRKIHERDKEIAHDSLRKKAVSE
ncbi:MAG TPA: ribosome-associated translation inhibitor RaiA [Candidatus Paceibacterota bacterium]|nr:ribosome-associated translation inhibitor RaiA [Candidatus Paceibacterota bacterium]